MKANHNADPEGEDSGQDVSNKTKILKWKQITTTTTLKPFESRMFPIRQRY